MRRSVLLQVTVHCPHYQRPVAAQFNAMIERLVACGESDHCRDGAPSETAAEPGRPFPRGCPVYPSR